MEEEVKSLYRSYRKSFPDETMETIFYWISYKVNLTTRQIERIIVGY